jgi:hypothetical protein
MFCPECGAIVSPGPLDGRSIGSSKKPQSLLRRCWHLTIKLIQGNRR